MDFLDRLMDFIEQNVQLNAVLKSGKLDEEEKAISIIPTPASMGARFMDAGKTHEYTFQVLTKDPDQVLVRKVLYDITSLLDGLSNSAIKSENGSYVFVKSEVYVLPHYVETTEHDNYIYTAMFTAELEGGI